MLGGLTADWFGVWNTLQLQNSIKYMDFPTSALLLNRNISPIETCFDIDNPKDITPKYTAYVLWSRTKRCSQIPQNDPLQRSFSPFRTSPRIRTHKLQMGVHDVPRYRIHRALPGALLLQVQNICYESTSHRYSTVVSAPWPCYG